MLSIRHTLTLFYQQATASWTRRIVFSLLLAWALYDSAMTFRDWYPLPWWARVYGFFGSLFLSLLFMGIIALAWDWLARRLSRT